VAQFLLDHGYQHVYALKGGFDAWEALGYPTEDKSLAA
jgi:rhodanese-related sulfurtransferase